MSSHTKFEEMHFRVAFSFPGEKRGFVEGVAEELALAMPKESIFYDNWYKPQLARLSLDLLLQDIYHKRSQLLVVFVCEEYERKEWCGIEWRAIRDLIKQRRDADVMLIRLDDASVSGVFSIDGALDARSETPAYVAKCILERSGGQRNQTHNAGHDIGFITASRRAAPYILCALPRGVLLIEDASPRADPNWDMTANYYHLGEGWRGGTHYHPSYRKRWQEHDGIEMQCRKTRMPEADWIYSHWPFHMMSLIGDAESHEDACAIVDSHCGAESFARLYLESDKPDPVLFTKPFPEWKRTGILRDLRQEIVTWKEHPAMRWGNGDHEAFAFSIAYRILAELSRHMSPASPSYSMFTGLLQQQGHKSPEAFWRWLELVDVALIDSIAIVSQQGNRTSG